MILGAAYLLWLYQRTMLGQVTNGKNLTIPDMNFREMAIFLPLIAWAIWIGVYPKPYFDVLRQPVAEIVERVRPGYFSRRRRWQPARSRRAARSRRRRRAMNQPVLHSHRSLHHHPGGDAGAVRLRHPAVRVFLVFPDPRQRKWLLIFVVLAEGFTGFGLYQQMAFLAANGIADSPASRAR